MNQPQQDICHHCGEKKKQLTKYSDGTQTNTTTKVCVNKECPISIQKSKLKTWK